VACDSNRPRGTGGGDGGTSALTQSSTQKGVKSTSHAIFAGAMLVARTRGGRLWRRTGIGTLRVRAPTMSMHSQFHPRLPTADRWSNGTSTIVR
jgi:hypothetical protein